MAATHKSLMLLTAVNFVPPAIARMPVPALQARGPLWFFGVPTVFAVTCLRLDARRRVDGHLRVADAVTRPRGGSR